MKPTVGRIVLFCRDGQELAAIVTRVYPAPFEKDAVDLAVFPYPEGIVNQDNAVCVAREGFGASVYWKWPPRV